MLNTLKQVFLGLVVLLSVSDVSFLYTNVFKQHKQSTQVIIIPQDPQVSDQDAVGYPEVSLTIQDMLAIMADYDLEHTRNTFLSYQYAGLTDYQHRKITISDNSDVADRLDTLLHEFYHIRYRTIGIETGDELGEKMIEVKAHGKFMELYGIKQEVKKVPN